MDVLNLFQWTETQVAINKLEVLLKCQLCDKLPTSPVVFPICHHTFCVLCLRERPSCSSAESNGCPLCGLAVATSVSDIRPDCLTAQLSEALQDLQSLLQNKTPPCGDKIPAKAGAQSGSGLKNLLKEAPCKNPCSSPQQAANSSTGINLPSCRTTHQSVPSVPPVPLVASVAPVQPVSHVQPVPPVQPVQPVPPVQRVPPVQPVPITPKLQRKAPQTAAPQVTPRTPQLKSASPKLPPATPKLDRRNLKGETLLHSACVKGDVATVHQLLEEGANPNSRDYAGWTPLHEACQHGHVEIAEALLLAGALPNVPGYEGNATPLHDAVEHGRDIVIRTLRRYGARDDLCNIYGHTARDLASLCQAPDKLLAALDTAPEEDAIKAVKRAGPPLHSIVVTSSNLSAEHSKTLQAFARLFRIRLVNEFCPEVSHVVVGCEGSRLVCLRTAKFMMGVVAGKWIVSHEWIEACMQQKTIVCPEPFEVLGSSQNAASGAPLRARVNASNMLPGLFSGCHIFLHGNFKSENCPCKRDLESLVRAGGAKLLVREPKPESIPEIEKTVPYHAAVGSPLARCSHYIIYLEGSDTEPKLKYDMAHIKSLTLSWLIDCVDHFELLPPFHSIT
ncbi:BRCA1-associated RING domain protein 1 [Hyalella azteca]|uniref:BRCA1-associated RING domain protein 1 n=1 Tax=Hyalella azteca TaxID=294128 RepID=A0A8B7N9K3_HYAAZ|nr:BRCA1-associated RING domain protein 1 [Hyalella azteca]